MERYDYDDEMRAFRRPGWQLEGRFVSRPSTARRPAFPFTDARRVGGGWRTGEPWGTGISSADLVTARELMTENPETVTPDVSLAEIAERMRDLDVGVIPVIDAPDSYVLSGVITDRDIVVRAAAEGKDMKQATAGETMSRSVTAVDEGATVRDIFSVMKRSKVRRVPVVDRAGRLVGIIAQADLSVAYAGLDPDRELEVEEVLERISEPAHPRRVLARGYDDREFGRRVRHRWRTLKREARGWLDRGYDRGF